MAGYGQLLDYEETPTPGLYRFITRDGRKVPFAGPAAEEYKRRLDEAKAMGPQPTAQLGPLANVGAALNPNRQLPAAPPPDPMTMKRYASDAPTPSPSAAPPTPKVDYAFGPNEEPPAPTGPQSLGLGFYRLPDGRIGTYDPGAAPSKGGTVERGRTVRGAFDANPEYLQGKKDVLDREAALLEQQRRQQTENFEANQALLQDQRVMLNDALNEETARNRNIEAGVAQAQAKRDEALKRYTTAKIDPGRAQAGGRNWISAIALAMSGYGSALAKQPPLALAIYQQRIADDIRAQEAEIAVKRDAADNALADLTRELGSKERAKIALAQIQNQMLQNSVAQQASREKDVEARAGLEKTKLGLQDQFIELNEKYRLASLGEVTKSYVNVPGSPGRAAGIRPVDDQLGTQAGLDKINAGQQKSGKLPSAASEKVATYDAALQGLDNFDRAHAAGGSEGVVTTAPIIASDKSDELDAKASALAPIIAQATGGDPDEIRSKLLSVEGDDITKAVDAYRAAIKAKRGVYKERVSGAPEPTPGGEQ